VITLFGASGYTGQQIAAELDRAGLTFTLVGRSERRLRQLSASLSSRPDYIIADVKRPASLNKLAEGADLIINCVGPFTDYGEPVVSLAAVRGVHYLDITNELGFVYRMQSYSDLARKTGAIIIPACGFEVAFSDCAARWLADKLGPCERIQITYELAGQGISVGTRRSALRSVATSWMAYHKGGITAAAPIAKAGLVELDGKHAAAVLFPSSETITIPSHSQTETIETTMVVSRLNAAWLPILAPIGAWGLQALKLCPLLDWFAAHLPARPKKHANAPFMIKVTAVAPPKAGTVYLAGNGVYEMTARIIAYAARQVLQDDSLEGGAHAPSAVLPPETFLQHAADHWAVSIRTTGKGLGSHAW
jgi:short subunit dehydrogenase-like uncharacterized protein